MRKHVLSVLVENQSGVLSRISGLFSRRGYNIHSLSVGETEDPTISRMTIVVEEDQQTLEQIKKQLNKLIDVIKIIELRSDTAVYRELALIKVRTDKDTRAEVIGVANIFRARIIDVDIDCVMIEATGDQSKLTALINMLEPYGLKEVIRTGITALERGDTELKSE
ncbi:MAG: acetolactate synthase small subunit [Epulopiscium sp.]|nr:acetolactate synthase small subunit [Candidatus Epulonipiscium sp.]